MFIIYTSEQFFFFFRWNLKKQESKYVDFSRNPYFGHLGFIEKYFRKTLLQINKW